MTEALDQFIASMLTTDRLPFWLAAVVFMVIGLFTKNKLFTRDRAYRDWGNPLKNQFWFWMRETLILHPLAAGGVLGWFWRDPEGKGWPLVGSMLYFATAGAVGLVLWIIVAGVAKRKGITLTLPGMSLKPPAD